MISRIGVSDRVPLELESGRAMPRCIADVRTVAMFVLASLLMVSGIPAPAAFAQENMMTPPVSSEVARGNSPDGRITVTVGLDREGRPSYAVQRNGRPLINDSRLGFQLTDAPQLGRRMVFVDMKRDRSDTNWTQPWGEWTTIRDNHVEMVVRLREKAGLKREMAVTFRIFDDGVGFRYTLPAQENLKRVNIAEELTEFAFAETGTAWWKPAYLHNREEYLYNRTALDAVGTAQTVMTVKLAGGTHLALHEAALVDYSAMNLARSQGNTFRASLTPSSNGAKVSREAGFSTPWRTIAITDNAPDLYHANRITLNLNEPNKLGDVSWVKPAKYVGMWWEMIKGNLTWSRGPRHGATTANVRKYIDFAAANGIPGVLVEGWNIGWDGYWFGNGTAMQFDGPTEDFDADALQRYARQKGVYLIGHNETGGSASYYDAQLDRAFDYAVKRGIPVIKTGYVTEAGEIGGQDRPDGSQSREWHEGQWMVNHHQRVLETAAKYRIAINSHEPVKDTGLRRTYPNWLSREGGRGMEYNAWEVKNPPEHEANLVFTQLLGGPMDFTPGILSLRGSKDSDILSTISKQLALYVILYSPVAMVADTPENYAKYPGPLKFIRDVPTDWSDTRVLNGEIGDYATIVRKAKESDDWYLGAIGDEQARSSTISLDFLAAGRNYIAEIYRDGPGADYRTAGRHSITIETRKVRKGEKLTLDLAPGGGQAIRFIASGKSRGSR